MRHLALDLARIPGVVAVTLGGSRAAGEGELPGEAVSGDAGDGADHGRFEIYREGQGAGQHLADGAAVEEPEVPVGVGRRRATSRSR